MARVLGRAAGGGPPVKLVLVGARGAGKTTVGRHLAERLGTRFLDTDALVEAAAGRPVTAIFAEEGEAGFRRRERAVCASLADVDGVIATGGGVVLDPANVAALRRHARVIWLAAPPDELAARCAGSDRPPLTGLGAEEEARAILTAREPLYRAAADHCAWTGCRDPAAVVAGVLTWLENRPSAALREELAAANPDPGEAAVVDRELTDGRLLCAVVGHPIGHSRSPAVFARLAEMYGLPYAYTRIDAPSADAAVSLARRLGLRGLSVTIPFKEAMLRQCDLLSPEAEAIGAVNTVVQSEGRFFGLNTDWLGVRAPLARLGGRGLRAVVLGAGGAAAAAAYALVDLGMEVTVLARHPGRAIALAARFGAGSGTLAEFDPTRTDVVVNATPVGMAPDTASILGPDDLRDGMTVFDLVYTPPETPLLRFARAAGATTVPGTALFAHQAAAQCEAFFGLRVSAAEVEEALR